MLLKLKIFFLFVVCGICINANAQTLHPVAFATKADITFIKENLKTNALLKESYNEVKKSVDEWVGKDIDVPFPKEIGRAHV